jgi:hypothetical protein
VLDPEDPGAEGLADSIGLPGEQLGPRRVVVGEVDRAVVHPRTADERRFDLLVGRARHDDRS